MEVDVSLLKAASAASVVILGMTLAPSAAFAGNRSTQLDDVIASDRRQLSPDEVRKGDVTDTKLGRTTLAGLSVDSGEIAARPRRVFAFGNQVTVVGAATPVQVFAGSNEAGDPVYEITPIARPTPLSPRAGFAVPPDSAWVHNADDDWTDVVRLCDGFGNNCQNTWKRQGFWNIQAAWNQGSYQYFRMYGRQTSSTITGTDYGWARTWLEFDNTGSWGGSPSEFEGSLPQEDYHSQTGATLTIGFKAGITFELGKAPVTVGGGVDQSYTGTIQYFYEYWHPIIRAEMSSGGVQYCRYDDDFRMTRKVTTRVGIRHNNNAQLGGWYIVRGMSDTWYPKCPGPN